MSESDQGTAPGRGSVGGVTGDALARALLRPSSVALVGISDDPAKTSGRPLRFMRSAGYAGEIFNINPQRDTVQGEKAWRSLDALPRCPDHVFVMTGAEQAVATLEQCAAIGVPLATVLAGGFGESGAEGLDRERRLVDVARRGGVRLLGPSSIGVVNVRDHLLLTANAAFAEPGLPAGDVLFASQSGSLIGALTSRGRVRDIGFHSLVSVGGEADLSIGEICGATLDDPGIGGYALFLESMRHADALRRFAEGAAARGKPVVAYKLGRSAVGAELAVSHTGSLAGDDELADAFMKHVGIVRLNTFEGLLEGLPLVRHAGTGARRRSVGVVTTTGGGAAMVVDQLGVRDVDVVAPTAATQARLAAAGVTAAPGRIVDLTLAGTRYETMKATLDVMLSAPEFGLVLVAIGSSARSQPQLAVRPVIDSAGSTTPLAVFIVPEAPDALAALAAAKVANFRTPETCADAIAAVLSRSRRDADTASRSPGAGVDASPPAESAPSGLPAQGLDRPLDEFEAYAQLGRVGIAHAPAVVVAVDAIDAASTPESGPRSAPQSVTQSIGQPTSHSTPRAASVRLSLPLEAPVAVKLLDASVLHKSDLGGVVLGVLDDAGLAAVVGRMRATLRRTHPALRFERVLVQTMRKGLGEVLLGFRRDAQIGPFVVLAAGGLMTEIHRDSSLRLAPLADAQAREMIGEVRALRMLRGYRGLPVGDVDALAAAIVAMSRLALLADPWVVEAEVNPLMVMPDGQGVVAVDAVVTVRERVS